jgi:hypothetical protein
MPALNVLDAALVDMGVVFSRYCFVYNLPRRHERRVSDMSHSVVTTTIQRVENGGLTPGQDLLEVEEPLENPDGWTQHLDHNANARE